MFSGNVTINKNELYSNCLLKLEIASGTRLCVPELPNKNGRCITQKTAFTPSRLIYQHLILYVHNEGCFPVQFINIDISYMLTLRYFTLTAITGIITQGLYPLSGHTSCRKISWSLETARFLFKRFQSLWNLTVTSAAALPRCLSNFRATRSL